jgi:hypothetical protein
LKFGDGDLGIRFPVHYQPVEKCHRGIFQPSPSAELAQQNADFIVILTSHPCDGRSLLISSTGC